jgi:hypothetical protein
MRREPGLKTIKKQLICLEKKQGMQKRDGRYLRQKKLFAYRSTDAMVGTCINTCEDFSESRS